MRSAEMLDSLGDDARKAMEQGGSWEYVPDDVSSGDCWAEPCDSNTCDRPWHKSWIMSGFEVRDGILFHVVHSCDDNGDWEVDDSHDVDGEDYEQWVGAFFDEDARQRGWEAYAEYVRETGDDPLDEYIVVREHTDRWFVKLVQDEHGIRFAGAHRESLLFLDGIAIKNPMDLPSEVRELLMLSDVGGCYYIPCEIKTLDDLPSDVCKVERRDDHAIITVAVTVPDHPDIIRERLRLAAEESQSPE